METKLRLMCSYGGHIIPRPNSKLLSYVGGESRIVALDRRTSASSFSAFSSHLSRVLFGNRPFHLKYHIPNDDLDALISVVSDEDLANMIDEHDRLSPPNRIRLFLFPVKAESLGPTLLDPKSDSWFCDALKGTRIMQAADNGRVVMGMRPEQEGIKLAAGSRAESFVLETSSSFGSTGSSFSMSNSPPVVGVVASEHGSGGLSLLDRRMRVPSSASLESDNGAGGAPFSPRTGTFQEPLIQVSPVVPPLNTKPEGAPDPSIAIQTQSEVDVLGCPSTHQADGKQQLQVSQEAPAICNKSENTHSDHSMNIPNQNTAPLLGYPLTQQQDGKHQPQVSSGAPSINNPEKSPARLSISIPTVPMTLQQDGKQQPQPSPGALPIISKPGSSNPHHSIGVPTQNTGIVLGYPLTQQQDGNQQPQVSPEALLVHNKSETIPDHSISIPSPTMVHTFMYPSTQQPDGNQQLQLSPEGSSTQTKYESTLSDLSIPTQTAFHVLGYPLTLPTDGKQQLQHETQIIQGGLHYLPQYPTTQMPISPYYPVYQMPMHQQPIHCQPNQPYPVYLVQVSPNQYHHLPMQGNFVDINSTSSISRPPLHPHTTAVGHHIVNKEIFSTQTVTESASNGCRNILSGTSLVSVSSSQAQMVTEPLNTKPATPESVASRNKINEFDDDVAYSQIYKSQPSAPVLPSQFPAVTSGSESQVQMQPNQSKEQAVHSLS